MGNETNSTLVLIFQIIAGIGSLATFGAFLFLFKKDKNKQQQLDKLSGIASMLEAQNETMKEQNNLITQEIDILRDSALSSKTDNDQTLKELKEIEQKKLMLSVKPNLWLNGGSFNGSSGEFKIDLNNKGEDAVLTNFVLVSGDVTLHSQSLPYDLDKGSRRYIFGRSNTQKHMNQCEYEIDVVYEDKLSNQYVTRIKGKGAHPRIIDIQEPN